VFSAAAKGLEMMLVALLYLIAALIGLFGAVLAFVFSRATRHPQGWLLVCGALLIFSALGGFWSYQLFTLGEISADGMTVELPGAITAIMLALLMAGGIYGIGRWFITQNGTESKTSKAEGFYRLIVDALPDPLVLKDREKVYRAANLSFEEMLGKDKAEIIGKKDADFFPRPQANAFFKADEFTLEQNAIQVQEQEVMGAEGKKWLQITRTPIHNGSDVVAGILVVSRDITAHKLLELDLEEKKQQIASLVEEVEKLRGENQQSAEEQKPLLRFERLLVSAAASFIAADPDSIEQAIRHSLSSIGVETGVDRCRILLFDDQGSALEQAYAWTAPEAADRPDRINFDPRSAFWSSLMQMQSIHVASVSQIQTDAAGLAEFMQTQKIFSFSAIPLISGRSVIGFLWLESASKELSWGTDFLDLLKSAAGILVSALDRMHKVQEIHRELESAQQRLISLEELNRENKLLNELGDLLQVCRIVDEAFPIIARYTQQLIPDVSGALYLRGATEDMAERVTSWGKTPPTEVELVMDECWALRRGRTHLVRDSGTDLNCAHFKQPLPHSYLCVPLIAQGDTIGLLHLRPVSGEPAVLSRLENNSRISELIAEQIALALSNLSLRDRLRSQAIRDPLTGLFNRRYMEETLDREIRRAIRHNNPVGVIMIDVDHLKLVNDGHGHDAGDIVLEQLGSLMMKTFRGEDVPCRYGGDEFTIVLPEATVSEAFRRAEQFREAFKKLDFESEEKHFGPVTLSLGIAAYPDHGTSAERLLQTADAACYSAKVQGRDRVMIGGEAEE
jgi:diguanylate cyclase (GGDEF)-like protein/PAS domain S-box-containing protein